MPSTDASGRSTQVYLVAGFTCSGKTRWAADLARRVEGLLLDGDNYAIAESELRTWNPPVRFDDPQAYALHELAQLLSTLLSGELGRYRKFDFTLDCVLEHPVVQTFGRSIVLEFIHAHHQLLIDATAAATRQLIWIQSPATDRYKRRFLRDQLSRGKSASTVLAELEEVASVEMEWVEASASHFSSADVLIIMNLMAESEHEEFAKVPTKYRRALERIAAWDAA